jgi:hypothetical protein
MKNLFRKLMFSTLIAATLTLGVSNAFASQEFGKSVWWHLDDADRERFEQIETGQ